MINEKGFKLILVFMFFSFFTLTMHLLAAENENIQPAVESSFQKLNPEKAARVAYAKISENYRKGFSRFEAEDYAGAYPFLVKAIKESGVPLFVLIDALDAQRYMADQSEEQMNEALMTAGRLDPKALLLDALKKYPDQEEKIYSAILWFTRPSPDEIRAYSEKIADLDKATKGLVTVNDNLANLAIREKNYAEAIRRYSRAIKINENLYGVQKCIDDSLNGYFYQSMIDVYLVHLKKTNSAIELIGGMKAKGYISPHQHNIRVAKILQKHNGDCKGAIVLMKEDMAGKSDSEIKDRLITLGDTLVECGNREEAKAYFQRAIKVNDDSTLKMKDPREREKIQQETKMIKKKFE